VAAALGGFALLPAIHFELMSWWDNDLLSGCVMWTTSLQVFALNAIWQVWMDRKKRSSPPKLVFPEGCPE
jgi:hypothetical protein